MVISTSRNAGFFAELTTTIRHIKKAKEDGKKIYINWDKNNSLYYDEKYGENVWEYFFKQIDNDLDDNIDYKLDNYIPLTPFDGYNTRETFNKLYNSFIKLNEVTKKIIDENVKKVDSKTLGLHLRKTDKYIGKLFNEPMAIPIDDEKVFTIIDSLIIDFDKIYLATDCSDTYNLFLSKYSNIMIPNNKIRGCGLKSIHTSDKNNGYMKGLESLIDCYTLSNCGFLIRSTSNLSSFSMFLNLSLECININEMFRNDTREHEFNIYSKKNNYEYFTNWIK